MYKLCKNALNTCKNIHNNHRRAGGSPCENSYDNTTVDTGTKDKDGNPSGYLDKETKHDGSKSIKHSKDNENSANNMDTIDTGDKTLESRQQKVMIFLIVKVIEEII